MKRSQLKIVGLTLAGAATCLICSCILDQHCVNCPPKTHVAADEKEWWERTVDNVDLAQLAVWVVASEVHKERHSTAVYQHEVLSGMSTFGRVVYEKQLPTPIPDPYLDKARHRLVGFHAVRPDHDSSWKFVAKSTKGCSHEEAMRIWYEAERVVLPRKNDEAPATAKKNDLEKGKDKEIEKATDASAAEPGLK